MIKTFNNNNVSNKKMSCNLEMSKKNKINNKSCKDQKFIENMR